MARYMIRDLASTLVVRPCGAMLCTLWMLCLIALYSVGSEKIGSDIDGPPLQEDCVRYKTSIVADQQLDDSCPKQQQVSTCESLNINPDG